MKTTVYLNELFGCAGRTAVVTGASSGLGAAMASTLARAGANVLAVARRRHRLEALAKETKPMEGRVEPCTADLQSPEDITHIADEVARIFGSCDVLVSNAGSGTREPLNRMKERNFSESLHLNTTAQWQLSKALFPLLKSSGSGRIINVASVYGLGASVMHGLGAYTTSKHALVGLTKSQAVEWAHHGITANALAPGYFPTELTESALADEKLSERLRSFTPQDRFGDPSELATALLFLASKASPYVTGVVLPIDGGWTAW